MPFQQERRCIYRFGCSEVEWWESTRAAASERVQCAFATARQPAPRTGNTANGRSTVITLCRTSEYDGTTRPVAPGPRRMDEVECSHLPYFAAGPRSEPPWGKPAHGANVRANVV